MTGERLWLELHHDRGGDEFLDAFDLLAPVDHPLRPYAIDWPAFWNGDDDDHDWLLEPLLARGRAHALYAAAKTGKSFVALAMAAAIATGRAFLGRPAGPPTPVVYADFEMSLDDVRERLEDFGYGPGDDLGHLHYVVMPDIAPLDTKEGGREFMESVAAWRAEVVFIDTTGRAVAGDENESDTIRDYFRHTGQQLKRAGVTVVRIDHAGKDPDRGQRGTSGKNDDVDVVAKLVRTDDGVSWTNTHRRVGWMPPTVAITIVEGDDGLTVFSLRDGPSCPAGTADTADELDALGAGLDITSRIAVDLLRTAGTPRRRQVVVAALRYRREQAESGSADPPAAISSRVGAEPIADTPGNIDRNHAGNTGNTHPDVYGRGWVGDDRNPPTPNVPGDDQGNGKNDPLDRGL